MISLVVRSQLSSSDIIHFATSKQFAHELSTLSEAIREGNFVHVQCFATYHESSNVDNVVRGIPLFKMGPVFPFHSFLIEMFVLEFYQSSINEFSTIIDQSLARIGATEMDAGELAIVKYLCLKALHYVKSAYDLGAFN